MTKQNHAIGFMNINGVIDQSILDGVVDSLAAEGISFKAMDMAGQAQSCLSDIISSMALFVTDDITKAYILGLLTNATYDVMRNSILAIWKGLAGKRIRYTTSTGSTEKPATLDLNMVVGKDSLTFKLDSNVSDDIKALLIDRAFDLLKSHIVSQQQHIIIFSETLTATWKPVPFDTLIKQEFEKSREKNQPL